jgi:hypothetical protein
MQYSQDCGLGVGGPQGIVSEFGYLAKTTGMEVQLSRQSLCNIPYTVNCVIMTSETIIVDSVADSNWNVNV